LPSFFDKLANLMRLPPVKGDGRRLAGFAGLVAFLVGLSIVGAIRSYSPIPYWDMWDGYLGFAERINEGDWSVWWSQHNEHRILLARLLFWMDLEWFNGTNIFLFIVNFLLPGVSAFVFWRMLRDTTQTPAPTAGEKFLGLFIVALLFLWCQKENLTWAFQSQFFLVQLLPLCALYWLHKSTGDHRRSSFSIAVGFGVASVGTMANGLLALPLMTLYALITRQRAIRIGVLAFLSIAAWYIYFHNYQAPAQHSSFIPELRLHPFVLMAYPFVYLGSPFSYFFGATLSGKLVAFVAGLILIGCSAWVGIRILRAPQQNTLRLALLTFVLYIVASACVTAGGRLLFGVGQALSSRYTTPALMAWAALLVLYAPSLLTAHGIRETRIVQLSFASLLLLMVAMQISAVLQSHEEELFEGKIAALALELQVRDLPQIAHIFPYQEVLRERRAAALALQPKVGDQPKIEDVLHEVDSVLFLAREADAQNLSVFGTYPFHHARELLGSFVQPSSRPVCRGFLAPTDPVDGDDRFVHVSGWLLAPAGESVLDVVLFLNAQNKVVGYALAGPPGRDIANVTNENAPRSGFQGYVLSDQLGAALTVQGERKGNPVCRTLGTISFRGRSTG